MKLNLLILAIIVAVAALLTLWSNKRFLTMETAVVKETIYDPAPLFSYTALNGQKGALEDHKGKTIMVHFWASWCAPCVIEFPDLIDLANSNAENLVILALTLDENNADIEKFMTKINQELPDNFLIIQDEQKAISEGLYGTVKLPETFLIKPDMTVAEKITGPQENWNSPTWRNKISRLSSE